MRTFKSYLLAGMAASFLAALVLESFGASARIAEARGPQEAANHQTALSSRTDLVPIPVSVTDPHGNFVAGLKAENFRVLEDGEPQSISFFEQENTPVTVGLIVDHSGSMGPKLRDVATAVLAFARSSNPDDEMFVIDFDDTVSVELLHGQPFTSDAQELSEAVTAISAHGQTALYDALAEGFVHLKLGRWNKKALVIVSDGGDNISRTTFSDVLATARASQTVIYAIGLLSENGREENPGVLRRLCRETGGIAFFPAKTSSVEAMMGQIARDLRGQYVLGYVPPPKQDSQRFRKLEVKVSSPGRGALRVRSRAGYSVSTASRANSAGVAP